MDATKKEILIEFMSKNNINYDTNVPYRKLSGINNLCILPFVVHPSDESEIVSIIEFFNKYGFTFDVFGGMTNVYLCNSYYRDVVVLTRRLRGFADNGSYVTVGCGYNLTKLSKFLSDKGFLNYEGFIGIPGSVGGAATNNAGAFFSSIDKVLIGVKLLSTSGKISYVENKDLNYSQRSSLLKTKQLQGTIISVDFDTTQKEEVNIIKDKIKDNAEFRSEWIDGKRKSLGSVFVSTTLLELKRHNQLAMTLKKVFNIPNKLFIKSHRLNVFLDFFFLGVPHLYRHCDSLNRFCWGRKTKEEDLFDYISTMQKLAHNKLKLELEIKK